MEKKTGGAHNFNKKKLYIGGILFVVIMVMCIITMVFLMKKSDIKSEKTEVNLTTESESKSDLPIKLYYHENYWEKYDLTNAVYKTQAEYESAVINYIDQITKLLNKQDWFKKYQNNEDISIELDVIDQDDGINEGKVSCRKDYNSFYFTIGMSNTMFKHNRSQLVHALTELIITKTQGYSSSIEDGIGEYVQNSLGMGIASYNYGLDIHNYLIEYTKKYEEDGNAKAVMSHIRDCVGTISQGKNRNPYSLNNHYSHDYSILCSYSFVDYLVQMYGIDSVMKMIDGYDESIYFLYNENGINGLVSDWKQFLENYPCKMTWDEMDAHITELKSKYAY